MGVGGGGEEGRRGRGRRGRVRGDAPHVLEQVLRRVLLRRRAVDDRGSRPLQRGTGTVGTQAHATPHRPPAQVDGKGQGTGADGAPMAQRGDTEGGGGGAEESRAVGTTEGACERIQGPAHTGHGRGGGHMEGGGGGHRGALGRGMGRERTGARNGGPSGFILPIVMPVRGTRSAAVSEDDLSKGKG